MDQQGQEEERGLTSSRTKLGHFLGRTVKHLNKQAEITEISAVRFRCQIPAVLFGNNLITAL